MIIVIRPLEVGAVMRLGILVQRKYRKISKSKSVVICVSRGHLLPIALESVQRIRAHLEPLHVPYHLCI
jgi:hypothetical protein